VISAKKVDKPLNALLIFPSAKNGEDYYQKIVEKIVEILPNLSVDWYAVPKKDVKEIQKFLDGKFEPKILKTVEGLAKKFTNTKNIKRKW
jgi:hypothetical protein